jgi:hypothetical protein
MIEFMCWNHGHDGNAAYHYQLLETRKSSYRTEFTLHKVHIQLEAYTKTEHDPDTENTDGEHLLIHGSVESCPPLLFGGEYLCIGERLSNSRNKTEYGRQRRMSL